MTYSHDVLRTITPHFAVFVDEHGCEKVEVTPRGEVVAILNLFERS